MLLIRYQNDCVVKSWLQSTTKFCLTMLQDDKERTTRNYTNCKYTESKKKLQLAISIAVYDSK